MEAQQHLAKIQQYYDDCTSGEDLVEYGPIMFENEEVAIRGDELKLSLPNSDKWEYIHPKIHNLVRRLVDLRDANPSIPEYKQLWDNLHLDDLQKQIMTLSEKNLLLPLFITVLESNLKFFMYTKVYNDKHNEWEYNPKFDLRTAYTKNTERFKELFPDNDISLEFDDIPKPFTNVISSYIQCFYDVMLAYTG